MFHRRSARGFACAHARSERVRSAHAPAEPPNKQLEESWPGSFMDRAASICTAVSCVSRILDRMAFRNSLVEGVSAVFSSVSIVLGALLEFGLPLLFWLAILFVPSRAIGRRFRRPPALVVEA